MSIFVFLAGAIHFTAPEKFLPAIPPFISHPEMVIFMTGMLEIILAILLCRKRTQDLAAKALALYFLILLPVHLYVSYYGIERFGVESKLLLWIRTGFQFVLYFWALSLQNKSWVIEQVWRNVLFIHYSVSPEKIKHLVPFELDLYDNQAILSVVPFYMDGIRFPFLPPIPKLSNLWELNIRTYVIVNGVKGIYFFTLETDSRIGEFVAKVFFHLPYRFSKIKAEVSKIRYHFEHSRDDLSFSLDAKLDEGIQHSDFDLWATERYSLFNQKKGVIYQGIVKHPPWILTKVNITQLNNQFTKMVTSNVSNIVGTSYAKEIKVSFQNFRKL